MSCDVVLLLDSLWVCVNRFYLDEIDKLVFWFENDMFG